jgi:hypothetical protein
LPTAGASAAKLAANTNPGRSLVNIPTFLAELKDFPRMIKQVGDVIRKRGRPGSASEAASWYLGYQFGIAPLISDLRKLCNFQDAVDQRVDELKRLYSKGGLRRRMRLEEVSTNSSTNGLLVSAFDSGITYRATRSTKAERWGTIRWYPTAMPNWKTDAEMRRYAQSLIFGLNAQSLASTAWELIPWSWMADWFFGVQNFIEAHNNAVPCVPSRINIMTHYTTSLSFARSDSLPYGGGIAEVKLESKARIQSGVSLNTNLPFLNGKQLSILGALAITRFR